MTQLALTTVWQSLGSGPFDLQVFSGTVVLQPADRKPAAADISGTIVTAVVGATPTPLAGPGEWWAKALLTNTVVSVTSTAAAAASGPAGAILGATADGDAIAGADFAAGLVLCLTADGRLRPASSSDPSQFGRVIGFALAAALAGGPAAFTRTDTLSNSAWTLTPGPVFVGENGGITQTEPTVGFVQPAGFAVSANTIVVAFEAPTLL